MKEISFTQLKKKIIDRSESVNSIKINKVVKKIIQDIRKNGNKALLKYVRKFENPKATTKTLVISKKKN